ncbi:hypothetical protein LCGC14_0441340 [marine sediment metagenome]|uniref:Uncharacterized protein n=1 Tax=marine sediment metagenome TaxID=412755 RepID=A0A0F9T3I6_9ZZZZ
MAIVGITSAFIKKTLTASDGAIVVPNLNSDGFEPIIVVKTFVNTTNGPGSNAPAVSGITFGVTALTKFTEIISTGLLRSEIFTLVGLSALRDITVTFAALSGGETAEAVVLVEVYTGVNQSTPLGGTTFTSFVDGATIFSSNIDRPSTSLLTEVAIARVDHALSPAGSDQAEHFRQLQGSGSSAVRATASTAFGKSPAVFKFSWGLGAGGPFDEAAMLVFELLEGSSVGPGTIPARLKRRVTVAGGQNPASPAFLSQELESTRQFSLL